MERLFGIPMSGLAVAMVAIVALALAALGLLASRQPVFVRLGMRNLNRRRSRTALIVVGLMLGTTIISSALTTGDTMSHTVRGSVERSLGQTDELVSVRGADIPADIGLGQATRLNYFDQSLVPRVERALEGSGRVDAIAPAVIEPVAAQNGGARRSEPDVTLFAADPERLTRFGSIEGSGGPVTLADLGPREVYLNADAADELDAAPGDSIEVFAAGRIAPVRVADVVSYDGTGTDEDALMMPLARAQALLGRRGEVEHVLVSNSGGDPLSTSDPIVEATEPTLAHIGLDIDPVKKDGLELADQQGDTFMSVFTTFGSFSIAAGILLIFLIFVMLAAERRSELGIARAVGTQRGHVVQMFVFEGVGYGLGAAAVGTLLGVGVAFVMVEVMASAFATTGLEIERDVQPRSMVVAFALGALLTLLVVSISAWRVSRLNIVAAVRNLPEPGARRGSRRRIGLGIAGVLVGLLMLITGINAAQATPAFLGFSIVVFGLVGVARALGAADRPAYTVGGLVLVVFWLLPSDTVNSIVGKQLSVDFSIWILSGLIVVTAATWLIIYNADALLGAVTAVAGRVRGLAPTVRMAMAYPLRGRFRTGVTLGMFTLVVFTVVIGATTSRAFLRAVDDVEEFGGGYDVRAQVAPASPIGDPAAAIRRSPELDPADFTVAASGSYVPANARQADSADDYADYPLRGFDDAFYENTSYGLGAVARGYDSPRQVWDAIADRPRLAVVDGLTVPRRANWNFGPQPDFRLHGFYLEDGTFDPVPVQVYDPVSDTTTKVTVIGVLKDTAPYELAGIWTSQDTAERIFGGRAAPTLHYFKLAPGVDAEEAAADLERAFLANGVSADSMSKLLRDLVGANYTLNWLLLGFMGLGLIVGVAALGVVSARAVVERRQQIGVLRSIGFRPGMVQLSFLLEASFIALTAIAVGTLLGLAIAYNVISDAAEEGSWERLSFAVPWAPLAAVFVSVYAAALLATLASAMRASRVYPAEALRYE